jgi:hypothetical protein
MNRVLQLMNINKYLIMLIQCHIVLDVMIHNLSNPMCYKIHYAYCFQWWVIDPLVDALKTMHMMSHLITPFFK